MGGAGRLHRYEEGRTETRRVGEGFWMKVAATEELRCGSLVVRGWKEPVVSHTADRQSGLFVNSDLPGPSLAMFFLPSIISATGMLSFSTAIPFPKVASLIPEDTPWQG